VGHCDGSVDACSCQGPERHVVVLAIVHAPIVQTTLLRSLRSSCGRKPCHGGQQQESRRRACVFPEKSKAPGASCERTSISGSVCPNAAATTFPRPARWHAICISRIPRRKRFVLWEIDIAGCQIVYQEGIGFQPQRSLDHLGAHRGPADQDVPRDPERFADFVGRAGSRGEARLMSRRDRSKRPRVVVPTRR
jgi:hypothetical protein